MAEKPGMPSDSVLRDDASLPGASEIVHLESELDVGTTVTRVTWSPDGRFLAVGRVDGRVSVFTLSTMKETSEWMAHKDDYLRDIAWQPGGDVLATSGDDGRIALWHWPSGRKLHSKKIGKEWVLRIAWSPDGKYLAVAPLSSRILIYDSTLTLILTYPLDNVTNATCLAWAPDGFRFAWAKSNKVVFYDTKSGSSVERLVEKGKQESGVLAAAWSPDGEIVATGGNNGLFAISAQESTPPIRLEGPDAAVYNVQFSPDGQLLAVKGTSFVTVWRRDPWELIATVRSASGTEANSGLAFHPDGYSFATVAINNTSVNIWRFDAERMMHAAGEASAFYVTAKIALLGESGVGKTSLACRIVSNEFQQHPSTHGQRFWVVPELAESRSDGATCEAILWDFAGQADYRLIHALLLDDVDVALLLFDPGSTSSSLQELKYWLRQLHRQNGDARVILVGARMDRAAISLSTAEMEMFCRENGISGGYFETSAMTGQGVNQLVRRIRDIAGWENIIPTITTVTFKQIKDLTLLLKSTAEWDGIILSLDELISRLHDMSPEQEYRATETRMAIAQLAKHGLVAPLRNAQDVEYVLLAPELLTTLASSVVLEVRRDPMELGTIDEQRLLAGDIVFPELANLHPHEQAVLLDSVVTLFVRYNLCFREFVAGRSMLLFPALINQRTVTAALAEREEGATYIISGATENIYAALVVLLGYTNTFTRRSQWRDRAEYEMDQGEICGFRLAREAEGELEIVLNYGLTTTPASRQLFQAQIERIISRRRATFIRFDSVCCTESSCGYVQDRGEVRRRVLEGRKYVFCSECGIRIPLIGITELPASSQADVLVVDANERESDRRTRFEETLVRLKALLRDRGQETSPSCFISYAWGNIEHERRIRRLADDLAKAGLVVLLDRNMNSYIGSSVGRFIDSLDQCDFVLVAGTPAYLRKYENRSTGGSVVAAEMDLIFNRLLAREDDKRTVLPVLMDGAADTSFPAPLRRRVYASIVSDGEYFSGLLDLILTMYQVPFGDPGVEQLRNAVDQSVQQRPPSGLSFRGY